MAKVNRRKFIFLGTAGTIATLGANWCISKSRASSGRDISSVSRVLYSKDGLLETRLEAGLNLINLGNEQTQRMTYNGQIPAPRLEVRPGDTLKIELTNNLDRPTNLHYHGLHVDPTANGDNPFLHIPPQERFIYEVNIPKNHTSGTFWYHPHHHHHAAEQLFGGLAGLLIVRGELDEIPEIKRAREEFLVLQDFNLDSRGVNHMELMRGREGNILTVNGESQPNFYIAKNGLLRLRLLNASVSRFYRLSLENHPFYLIATDGGAIAEPVELNELLLAPGERAELLIKGDRKEGQYRLFNLPYDRGSMGMMGMMGMMRGNNSSGGNYPRPLATLTYKDKDKDVPLPTKLISLEPLPAPITERTIKLSGGMMAGSSMEFLFNGQTFDPERIDSQVQLNTVEDWELVNMNAPRMDHPFHLHTNSFQIIARNGQPEPYRAWKDTVLVKRGESVKIRVPFRDFIGKTVYHCHISDHEDLGMMGVIQIILSRKAKLNIR